MPLPIPPPRQSGLTTTTESPLYWASWGTAGNPRILVVHGGPGAHHDYLLPQMLELTDESELFFYDQRGGGKSRMDGKEPITWKTHVRDLGAVVRELSLEPLTVIGYSWGALLTLLYVLEGHTDTALPRPVRMVLIDPAPLNREFRREFETEFARRQRAPGIEAARNELSASGLRESDPDAFRQRSFELGVAGYFARPSSAHDLTQFRVIGRIQQSVWESLGDYDLIPKLAEIRIPTLIVHGRDDPIPVASSSQAADAMGAELVLLDDCGHVPYVEQPGRLFPAIRMFLERTGTHGESVKGHV